MFRFLVILAIMFPNFAYGYECSREIDLAATQTGIQFYCRVSSIPYMASNINAENAPQTMINDVEYPLKVFVDSYNKEFLKRFAKSINLVYNLTYNNSKVGGLSNGSVVYINLNDYSYDYKNTFYSRALNHEFSSNLYRALSYKEKDEWMKISNSYDSSEEYMSKCLTNGTFYRQNDKNILKAGFLSYYALTNPENDFNVYAERLFGKDNNLKNYAQNYPKVKAKLELMKKFYRTYGFTKNFPDET